MEKKISLALLFAIIVQTAGALMWAGATAAKIDAIAAEQELRRPLIVHLAQVETELELMRAQLDRIERKLEAVDAD